MASPDLSEFEVFASRKGPQCTIELAAQQLDAAQRQKLLAALAASHISHTAIVKWLRQNGHSVSSTTVGRHRRKECSCG